jgi:hypothetical protein
LDCQFHRCERESRDVWRRPQYARFQESFVLRIVDLAGELAGIVRRIEASDTSDARVSVEKSVPKAIEIAAKWAYNTNSGNCDSPHTHHNRM